MNRDMYVRRVNAYFSQARGKLFFRYAHENCGKFCRCKAFGMHVGRRAGQVMATGHPANGFIVSCGAIGVVYQDWFSANVSGRLKQVSEFYQVGAELKRHSREEDKRDDAEALPEFAFTKVGCQVAHGYHATLKCSHSMSMADW